jgi:hypothetical protein
MVMTGELGRDWSLPLLPAGTPMFEGLPLGALVLAALAPAVGNGTITVRDGGREGVLVIRDGIVSETVWVGDGVRSTGDAALTLIHDAAHTAMVSACRLSDDAMRLVGSLIRGDPCYADLRLEWVVWPNLLNDLRERGATYVIELSTPNGHGVTVIKNGRHAATFADFHPTLGDPDLLDDLAAGSAGTIRVLIDRGSESATEPDLPPVAAPPVEAPRRESVDEQPIGPTIIDTDDPNATLSALFGPHPDGADRHRPIGIDRSMRRGTTPVESVLPQLKLMVQNRLHRSSGSVDEIVDGAAHDGESVAWLADRVRVMTVRGFLHTTFDQLADDMLALSDSRPG